MMQEVIENYNNRDFWIRENRQYAEPNFRLRKCARLVNEEMQGRQCTLLDVGCGPAALRRLLGSNVNYHGLDIALHEPAPYLLETDFVQNPISFNGKRFDIIVALGVFEYMGGHQSQKLAEISRILKKDGKFILSYINFSHFRRIIYPIYNNVRTIGELKQSLQQVFHVEKCFPVSHHWRHKQPGKNASRAFQMQLNWNIPLVSSWLAVEYFCICSRRK
jgi:cyclopropane fatty-acyl-phospholipid synthase-like methyltransferase